MGKQRQNFFEFKGSLVYIANCSTVRATNKDPVSKQRKITTKTPPTFPGKISWRMAGHYNHATASLEVS